MRAGSRHDVLRRGAADLAQPAEHVPERDVLPERNEPGLDVSAMNAGTADEGGLLGLRARRIEGVLISQDLGATDAGGPLDTSQHARVSREVITDAALAPDEQVRAAGVAGRQRLAAGQPGAGVGDDARLD